MQGNEVWSLRKPHQGHVHTAQCPTSCWMRVAVPPALAHEDKATGAQLPAVASLGPTKHVTGRDPCLAAWSSAAEKFPA